LLKALASMERSSRGNVSVIFILDNLLNLLFYWNR
jgi:hypothetical protein